MYAAIPQPIHILINFIYTAVLILCVTRDPTSVPSVILTFLLIVVLVLVSYAYYYVYVHHTIMGSPTHKRGGEVYIQVQNDGDGDVEMSTHTHTQVPSHINPTSIPSPSYSKFNIVTMMLYKCRYVICGCLCCILGLTCFALQSVELYYVLHSLWHLGMMLAAFCMLKGREDWFDLLKIQRDLL